MTKCVPFLESACQQSSLRVAKTVRAPMVSMDALLAADPDLRVIHLLRDPRAVVSSRRAAHDESVIGRYSLSGGPVDSSARVRREAVIYCRTAVLDILVRRRLEAKYPGRILTVGYENVAADLRRHAELVYRFLGFDAAPDETRDWIEKNEEAVANAKANATKTGYLSPVEKWTKRLASADSTAIVRDICHEFFQLVGTGSRPTLLSTLLQINVPSSYPDR